MKAVILAAGQGTRIRSVVGARPKCLIPIGDQTILDRQLKALYLAGIAEVAVVVGYEKDQIIDHVQAHSGRVGPKVHFIENPAFAFTNNIYSLWLAREWLRGDGFTCLNADVIFDPEILLSALQSKAPISMIVDPEWRDETMKVIIRNGFVTQMSKKIPPNKFSGTYIGITTFQEAMRNRFFGKMEDIIGAARVNEFFNVAVQELVDEGVDVGFATTDGFPWAEIDDPHDLAFAQENVFPLLTNAFSPPANLFPQLTPAVY